MGDDIVVGFEDAVGEPVLAHEEPEIFNRVQLWRFRRQRQNSDVGGDNECVGHMPTGLVHDEDGMCAIGDVTGYFCQMLGHCVGITPRHYESGGLAELGADCTEDVGGAGSLVMRRERP